MKTLSLRPCLKTDAAVMMEWRAEPATRRYNPLDDINQKELERRIIPFKGPISGLEFEVYRWIVELDHKPIGNVTLKNINKRMGLAEIGYSLSQAYHGRGLGTATVKLFVDMIFEQTPLRKLIAFVATENEASWRILEKLGFVREGKLREHFLINDRYHDEFAYGLLRSEYHFDR
jgi:ribosomal-protein-alanine N-acetyltransferase